MHLHQSSIVRGWLAFFAVVTVLAGVAFTASASSSLYSIKMIVPADRTKLGTLELVGAGGVALAGPFWIYAKADNQTATKQSNPTRDPARKFGDTPIGGYSIDSLAPSGASTPYSDTDKFGPFGVLKLTPVSGQALIAKNNGRSGLLIHGGKLRVAAGREILRPTNGCVRMRDVDVQALVAAIRANNITYPLPLEVVQGTPSGVPSLYAGPDENYNEGEPARG